MDKATGHLRDDEKSERERKLVLAFGGIVAAALVAVFIFVWVERSFIPAPRISASATFNEKARWLGEE